jgi:hypothetical protein
VGQAHLLACDLPGNILEVVEGGVQDDGLDEGGASPRGLGGRADHGMAKCVGGGGRVLVVLLGVEEGRDCAHASTPEDELLDVLLALEVINNGC